MKTWNVDSQGKRIPTQIINEQCIIKSGKIALNFIPDSHYKINIASMVEINFSAIISSASQFKVNYDTGEVFFSSSKEGTTIIISSYYSIGKFNSYAKNINLTNTNNSTYIATNVEDFATETTSKIGNLSSLQTADKTNLVSAINQSIFNGGIVNGTTQFNQNILISDTNAVTTEATLALRRTISQTGGTNNQIGNGLGISTVVNVGVNSAEFVISSVIDAYNTSDAGQLALIAKGNKHADVPVWGANLIAQDYTGLPSASQGMFGLEIDIDADLADTNNNRKGLYLAGRRSGTSGTAEFYAGIDITAEANAKFTNGLVLKGIMNNSITISSNHTIGIDFAANASATNTTQIRLRDYDKVALSTDGSITMRYNTSTDFIEFFKGATRAGYISMSGVDHAL